MYYETLKNLHKSMPSLFETTYYPDGFGKMVKVYELKTPVFDLSPGSDCCIGFEAPDQ